MTPALVMEKAIFLLLNCFGIFVKNQLGLFVWLFLRSLFCPTDLCVCSSTSITRSWLLSYSSIKVFFFFKNVVVLMGPVPFHINFRIKFSMPTKILLGFCWELQ